MWRLEDEVKLTQLAALTTQLQTLAVSMRAAIPGLLRLEVGSSSSKGQDAADLLLFSEFESWSALEVYETHPLHVQLKTLLSPLRKEKRVVDYET